MHEDLPFLDCNIISVHGLTDDDGFYLIDNAYYYNSLNTGILTFNQVCIQIPEFEIRNIHLLDGLDYEFINKFSIPIIKRVLQPAYEYWEIDLTRYEENRKLQSHDIYSKSTVS